MHILIYLVFVLFEATRIYNILSQISFLILMQHLFLVDPQYILHNAKKYFINLHPHLREIEMDLFIL